MSVKKRTYNSGKTVWYFIFDAPGSTRANRRQIKESGFATKNEARNAEAGRRVEEQKKYELTQARSVVDAPLPKTLGALLKEFFQEHAEKKLAPKTVERYREQAGYLAQELLEMPLEGITALHLGREWNRLLESGGHHRKTKAARPLSAKTVRNIAGVVSSAFARAIRWGLVTSNPVQNSEPPVARRHRGVALDGGATGDVGRGGNESVVSPGIPGGGRRYRLPARRDSGAALVGHPGRARDDCAVSVPDEGRGVRVQDNEDGHGSRCKDPGFGACHPGGPPEAAREFPHPVRAGLLR